MFCLEQVGRIPFDEQLRNFENTLNEITGNLGADYMATELSRCIFFVGMGSNDYLNNYLMPNYNTRNQYNGQQYADLLVQTYNNQITVRFLLYSKIIYSLYVLVSMLSYTSNARSMYPCLLHRGFIISEQGNL
jgi:hypothetical protein